MVRAALCRLARALVWGLAPLALAACAASGPGSDDRAAPEAATPTPAALRLVIAGDADPVFALDQPIPVELNRDGADAPVTLEVRAGSLSVARLPPGHYAVTRIGPLACAGIGFDLGPGPQALGTLRAEVLRTEYDVALISAVPATPADLAELGADAADAPLTVHRQALCHSGRGGTGTQFRDLSPAEQIMAGILFAGFCAAAVASGGFCAF